MGFLAVVFISIPGEAEKKVQGVSKKKLRGLEPGRVLFCRQPVDVENMKLLVLFQHAPTSTEQCAGLFSEIISFVRWDHQTRQIRSIFEVKR